MTTLALALTLSIAAQDAVTKLMTDYLNAARDDDAKARAAAFDKLAEMKEPALKAVQAAFENASLRNRSLRIDLKSIEDELARDGVAEDRRKELEKKRDALKGEIDGVMRQIPAALALKSEIPLRTAWADGKPLLDSGVGTVRSFAHFAAKGDWKTAATCLASGDEKDAKSVMETIDAFRKDAPPEAHWLEAWAGGDVAPVAFTTANVLTASKNGSTMECGDTLGGVIVKHQGRDTGWRILRAEPGGRFDLSR